LQPLGDVAAYLYMVSEVAFTIKDGRRSNFFVYYFSLLGKAANYTGPCLAV